MACPPAAPPGGGAAAWGNADAMDPSASWLALADWCLQIWLGVVREVRGH